MANRFISVLAMKRLSGRWFTTMSELATEIKRLVAQLDQKVQQQNQQLDAMRSIIGRLQVFAREGFFVIDGSRWIRAEAITEILEAANGIVDGKRTAEPNVKSGNDCLDVRGVVSHDCSATPVIQALDY